MASAAQQTAPFRAQAAHLQRTTAASEHPTARRGSRDAASPVSTGALKMQDQKMQDLKMEDQIAGVENAGPENAGPPVNTANR